MTTYFDRAFILLLVDIEVAQFQTLCPIPFVQIHEHRLLELRFAIVHCNGVIVTIQPVNQGLNGRLVDVTNVRGCLSRLTAGDDSCLADKSECVDHNLSLHRLNWINDDRNCAGIQRLERLGGIWGGKWQKRVFSWVWIAPAGY